MRSFFVQIFLSFWISTVAIFVAATVLFPRHDHADWKNGTSALQVTMNDLARAKIRASADGHCGANEFEQHLMVVNAANQEICGHALTPELRALISSVRSENEHRFSRVGDFWAAGEPMRDMPSGYVAVLLTPFQKGSWFPTLPKAALPVSALVTFVFAYFLTNPVRALRKAFRRFAGGELTVRLPVVRKPLRDWGGADVRTLMVDFNEMADRIQALLIAHKTLLRDVSHELRSPLARLNVALELAREESGDSITALDRAELESSRLNGLIGELLSLSHMESLQDVPQPRTVCLDHVIEELMPDLIFEAEARGCVVSHEKCPSALVPGSEEVLRRAVENVIRNAIRYSPSDGLVVIKTSVQTSGPVWTATLSITDRGPGVPEESLGTIFRPFYRVDASRQLSTGGFGVGLAIAERAVFLHHGSIEAHNRPGGGLCVEMTFPCARSEGDSSASLTSTPASPVRA
jgi:two-component system, OmpR family, sensor histidine kinase CpxA